MTDCPGFFGSVTSHVMCHPTFSSWIFLGGTIQSKRTAGRVAPCGAAGMAPLALRGGTVGRGDEEGVLSVPRCRVPRRVLPSGRMFLAD
eukprot:6290601-Prymnesium_polylepis.1